MLTSLARFFRGLNMMMGVTTLPNDAAPAEERKFVGAWLGIIAFLAICFAILFFWIVS